jgi:ribosomal protein L11 methyltransferase
MSSSSKAPRPAETWCWHRRILAREEENWIKRLGADTFWTLVAKPGGTRPLLSAYASSRGAVEELRRQWGGKVRRVRAEEWTTSRPVSPLRIGGKLEIVHEETRASAKKRPIPRLHIPCGLAFGSGEHATTAMLLRALARQGDLSGSRVLDLGTGSGILALAARQFGARRIVATDFDADAIRTARQNEMLNFGDSLIRWRQADVKRLRATARHDLVLANLYSGILVQAAERIAGSVGPGGRLWLSGILREQEREVIAAYRRRNLRLFRAARRGKWVLLQWQKTSWPLPAAAG